MTPSDIPLAKEISRVPSMTVPLDKEQEVRFQRLMEEIIMIDLHQHPMVFPEDMTRFVEYVREGKCRWGYRAVRHGGWTAVATANCLRGFLNTPEMSFLVVCLPNGFTIRQRSTWPPGLPPLPMGED